MARKVIALCLAVMFLAPLAAWADGPRRGRGGPGAIQMVNRVEKSCKSLGGVWDDANGKCRIIVDPEALCREYNGNWNGGRCVFPVAGMNFQ